MLPEFSIVSMQNDGADVFDLSNRPRDPKTAAQSADVATTYVPDVVPPYNSSIDVRQPFSAPFSEDGRCG
jgi:hypothetical protein